MSACFPAPPMPGTLRTESSTGSDMSAASSACIMSTALVDLGMAAVLGRTSAVMLRLLPLSPAAAELPKILKRGTMRDATPLELFFLMATADLEEEVFR